MYRNTMPQRTVEASSAVERIANQDPTRTMSKTNKICDAFLVTFRDRPTTHVQNIISAHVCKNPPDMEAGLLMIADLQSKSRLSGGDDLLTSKSGKQADEAQEAVEHICFLSDANRLYDKALGLYDLDLTLLIAQQSQKVSLFGNYEMMKLKALMDSRTLESTYHFYRVCRSCQS